MEGKTNHLSNSWKNGSWIVMHEVITSLIMFSQEYVIDSCRFCNYFFLQNCQIGAFKKRKLIVGILLFYLWSQTSKWKAFFHFQSRISIHWMGALSRAVSKCLPCLELPVSKSCWAAAVLLPLLIRGDNRRCRAERSGGGKWSQSWPCSVCLLSAMANALLLNDWLFSCGSVYRN